MSNSLKSFAELGDVYLSEVLLAESKKNTDNDLGFKKAGHQKDDGPEAADGFNKKLTEKKTQKKETKKEVKESIQEDKTPISKNMDTKKLTFDELYERAMNEGPDSVTTPVVDEPEVHTEPDGDENPADITTDVAAEPIDPKELFAQLCELVYKLKEFYGIEDEEETGEMDGSEVTDIEDIKPEESTMSPMAKESIEVEKLPDSKGLSLQNKDNNVGGVKVVKKKAEDGKIDVDPSPKPLGDKGAALKKKDNKVGGSGAQAKVGASVFES